MDVGVGLGAIRRWRDIRHSCARETAGLTLIELLITVTILGIIATAMGGTLTATVMHSASNRDDSVLDAEIRRAIDAVRSTPYIACGYGEETDDPEGPEIGYGNNLPAATDRPSGMTMSVSSVNYWNGVSGSDPDFSATACPVGGDKNLQLVTITVVYHGTTRSSTVVKRYFQ
jgi:prepilin-type N-terminal cleavage/methylation domain-containing protein